MTNISILIEVDIHTDFKYLAVVYSKIGTSTTQGDILLNKLGRKCVCCLN